MYTFDSRVRYSEIDHQGTMTLPALINYFQDCSTFQSESLGLGMKALREKKKAWVLSYWQVDVYKRQMEARPGVLEGKLPFEEMVYAENEEGANYYIENIRDEFTVSVVNSRKIGLHVMIEMEIGKEKLEDEETTVDAESTVPIYKKMKSVNLLKLNTTKKDTYRIKEEITLPGTKESIGVLLVSSISSRKLEIRPEMDALLIKGELLVFCLYLSEDEKTDWIEQSVPFEGRLACDGVEEGMYYHVQHTLEDTLVDVRMDEDGEMRILGIELSLIHI